METVHKTSISHRVGSLIVRKANTLHRITHVLPGTKTLFIAWTTSSGKWKLEENGTEASEWIAMEPEVYARNLYGETRYCEFDRFRYKAADSAEQALGQTEPSINQTTPSVDTGLVMRRGTLPPTA